MTTFWWGFAAGWLVTGIGTFVVLAVLTAAGRRLPAPTPTGSEDCQCPLCLYRRGA